MNKLTVSFPGDIFSNAKSLEASKKQTDVVIDSRRRLDIEREIVKLL